MVSECLVVKSDSIMDAKTYRKINYYFQKRFARHVRNGVEKGEYNDLDAEELSKIHEDYRTISDIMHTFRHILWGLITKSNAEYLNIDYDNMIKEYADKFNACCIRQNVNDFEIRITNTRKCGFRILYKFSEYGFCDIEDIIDYLLGDFRL